MTNTSFARRFVVLLGVLAVAATAVACSDEGGSIEVASSTSVAAARTTTTVLAPAAATTVPVVAPTDAPTSTPPGTPALYLEETRPTSGSVTLVLHSGDGAVIRDVYTTSTFKFYDDPAASPILDAELAPDGTVYVVERTDRTEEALPKAGGTRLARIAEDGTATTVKENVTSSEISPDGLRMAVRVVSPDGNGDGMGTDALRIIDLATGAVDELKAHDLSVDETGVIMQETGNTKIMGWIHDQASIIIEESCCDDGSVTVVPTSSAAGGSAETWPQVGGDHATYVLGLDGQQRVLVQRDTFARDAATQADAISGIEVVALGADGAPTVVFREAGGMDQEDRPRIELVGKQIAGAPLPISFEGPRGLSGASIETTPRRFF